MSSSYRESLNSFLSDLEIKAAVVLDLGASQQQLSRRVKKFEVDKYVIADLPEPHENSPKPELELDLNENLFDLRIGLEYWGRCDIVCCFEVMEYIYSPLTAFRNIALFLKPQGIAYVSFPSVYPLHEPIENDALRYMPGGIRKLAESANLTITRIIKRRPETNLLELFYKAERMRAAKNVDHHFTGFIVEFCAK